MRQAVVASRRADEPVAEVVPNTQPHRIARAFKDLQAQGDFTIDITIYLYIRHITIYRYREVYMHANNVFGERGLGFRARRGDLAPTILRLLLEKPMHGYEIITTLQEKTHGMWRPSAGAVYPTLQLLEEQELVAGKVQNDKRVYALTESGRKQAKKQTDEPAWNDERVAKLRSAARHRAALETISLVRRIVLAGTAKDIKAAEQILETANKKLAKLATRSNKE